MSRCGKVFVVEHYKKEHARSWGVQEGNAKTLFIGKKVP